MNFFFECKYILLILERKKKKKFFIKPYQFFKIILKSLEILKNNLK